MIAVIITAADLAPNDRLLNPPMSAFTRHRHMFELVRLADVVLYERRTSYLVETDTPWHLAPVTSWLIVKHRYRTPGLIIAVHEISAIVDGCDVLSVRSAMGNLGIMAETKGKND